MSDTSATEGDPDDLDAFIAEQLTDPAFRAAYEALQRPPSAEG